MVRESRSSWVLRNMKESRETLPEKNKAYFVRDYSEKKYQSLLYSFGEEDIIKLSNENKILCNNVKELQQQLQKSDIRIKNLTTDSKQMELF